MAQDESSGLVGRLKSAVQSRKRKKFTDQETARIDRLKQEARQEAQERAQNEFREEYREELVDEYQEQELERLRSEYGLEDESPTANEFFGFDMDSGQSRSQRQPQRTQTDDGMANTTPMADIPDPDSIVDDVLPD